MIAANSPDNRCSKVLCVDYDGAVTHTERKDLASLFSSGDVVVVNDSATLPASLMGKHCRTGQAIEIRLAGWESDWDRSRFIAIAFGPGSHRTPTEKLSLIHI